MFHPNINIHAVLILGYHHSISNLYLDIYNENSLIQEFMTKVMNSIFQFSNSEFPFLYAILV
jgi:hypothetical protein